MKKLSTALFVGCSILGVGLACAQEAVPPTDTDNTRVNKRDRSHETVTPTDQSNDKADIRVAADVRSAIVKDKSLSTKAHNVKIVANGGVVVLRGPVASADEKAKVEKLASSVAGVTRVDNQLDVAH